MPETPTDQETVVRESLTSAIQTEHIFINRNEPLPDVIPARAPLPPRRWSPAPEEITDSPTEEITDSPTEEIFERLDTDHDAPQIFESEGDKARCERKRQSSNREDLTKPPDVFFCSSFNGLNP